MNNYNNSGIDINKAISDIKDYLENIKKNPFTESQKEAILHIGNVIESAGAGCGKTSVLVEKICQFIRVGIFKINEVIIMTFTNNATNEMKSRIKERLNNLLSVENNSEYKNNLNNAILSINSANVSTIDSLCKKIVETNFEKLNDIPVNSRIADETELKVLMYQVFDEVIEKNINNEKFSDFFKAYFNKSADIIKDNLLYEGMRFIYNFAWPEDFFDINTDYSKIENEYNDLLKECYINYEKKKIEKSVMAISDLAHLSLRVLYKRKDGLKEFTDVSESLQSTIKYLFVDEYQDTSFVQEELIKAINGNFKKVNTFLVGDIKQSIYRFRNSRVEFFKEKVDTNISEKLDYNIDIIKTNDNFRSDPHIINFVNDFFEKFMSKEISGFDYKKDHSLIIPKIKENVNNDDNKVEINVIHKYESSDKTETIDVSKSFEAEFIAKRIKELVSSSNKYTYNDIVILHRNPSSIVKDFEKAFRKYGIPLTYEKKSGFYDSYEIRLLMAFLNIIDNPMQDIYFTSVINTGIFNVSLDDLSIVNSLRSRDESYYTYVKKLVWAFDYSKNDENENNEIKLHCEDIKIKFIENYKRVYKNDDYNELIIKIKRFLDVLNNLIEKSRYKSAVEIIEDIFSDVNLIEYVCGLQNHETGKENLLYFLELARDISKTSYRDVYNFNIYLDSLVKKKADLGEAELAIGVPKVRIITIHKSKGMQYKIVILPCLSSQLNVKKHNKNDKDVYFTYDDGISLNNIDIDNRIVNITDKRKRIVCNERAEVLEEYLRLLYVATTRPCEKLICSIRTSTKGFDLSEDKVSYISKRRLYGNLVYFDEGDSLMSSFGKMFFEYLNTIDDFINSNEDKESYADNVYKNNDIVLKISSAKSISEYLVDENIISDNFLNVNTTSEFFTNDNFINDLDIKPKYSVSEIKHEKNEKFNFDLYMKMNNADEDIDKDIKVALSGSDLGTVYHNFMHLYSFDNEIENKLSMIYQGEKEIDKELFINKIKSFLKTDVANEMKKAYNTSRLFREQRFMKNFNIKDIYEKMGKGEIDIDSNVIVQGVIDCFYINDNDEIVLIDYKTDFLNRSISDEKVKEELKNMYDVQLNLYAKSLEEITGKKVCKILIYSFKIDEYIEIEAERVQ